MTEQTISIAPRGEILPTHKHTLTLTLTLIQTHAYTSWHLCTAKVFKYFITDLYANQKDRKVRVRHPAVVFNSLFPTFLLQSLTSLQLEKKKLKLYWQNFFFFYSFLFIWNYSEPIRDLKIYISIIDVDTSDFTVIKMYCYRLLDKCTVYLSLKRGRLNYLNHQRSMLMNFYKVLFTFGFVDLKDTFSNKNILTWYRAQFPKSWIMYGI